MAALLMDGDYLLSHGLCLSTPAAVSTGVLAHLGAVSAQHRHVFFSHPTVCRIIEAGRGDHGGGGAERAVAENIAATVAALRSLRFVVHCVRPTNDVAIAVRTATLVYKSNVADFLIVHPGGGLEVVGSMVLSEGKTVQFGAMVDDGDIATLRIPIPEKNNAPGCAAVAAMYRTGREEPLPPPEAAVTPCHEDRWRDIFSTIDLSVPKSQPPSVSTESVAPMHERTERAEESSPEYEHIVVGNGAEQPRVSTVLPAGWSMFFDANHCRHYYVQRAQKKTQWEHPMGDGHNGRVIDQVRSWMEARGGTNDSAKRGRLGEGGRGAEQQSQMQPSGQYTPQVHQGQFGTQQAQFGTQPQAPQGQFGTQPQTPHGQFGTQPQAQQGQYGVQHQAPPGQYSTPPSTQGYSAPPQAQGQYSAPPQAQGYSAAPQAQGQYSALPQAQGQYSAPPQAQGYSAAPQAPQGQGSIQTISGLQSHAQAPGNISTPQNSNPTNPLSAQTPLPRGWEERFDARVGRFYYVDHNTQRTTWDRPY